MHGVNNVLFNILNNLFSFVLTMYGCHSANLDARCMGSYRKLFTDITVNHIYHYDSLMP